jgi:hypothetical protein
MYYTLNRTVHLCITCTDPIRSPPHSKCTFHFSHKWLIYRQVSFYVRVMFLKNITQIKTMKIEHKIPLKTMHFLGVRGLTSSYLVYDNTTSGHTDLYSMHAHMHKPPPPPSLSLFLSLSLSLSIYIYIYIYMYTVYISIYKNVTARFVC